MYVPYRGGLLEQPERRQAPAERKRPSRRAAAAKHRRRFITLVVIPILLMLGSVYLHTVASRLDQQSVQIQQQVDKAEAENRALGVKVAELSRPERIRSMARSTLGMQDPSAENLHTYRGSGAGKEASNKEGGVGPQGDKKAQRESK